MKKATDLLPIGDLAKRTGLSVSAIRFYEAKDLIHPIRNNGNQRRFFRSDIRRLSFIIIAQQLGLTIREIKSALASLPENRTPTLKDWMVISRIFRKELDAKIEELTRTRDRLDSCIGCGCLSLRKCALYNPDDRLGKTGVGALHLQAD